MVMMIHGSTTGQLAGWQLLWRSHSRVAADRKVVLGLGGLTPGEEAPGVQVLPYLEGRLGRRSPVEWIAGEAVGLNLFALIEQCSHLLVIDAVDGGRRPGEVMDLSLLRLLRPVGYRLSGRLATFQDALEMAQVLGQAPANFRLVGLQPGYCEAGKALRQPTLAALPALAERVEVVLEGWGLVG
jgi:hydrogenase maturation protease